MKNLFFTLIALLFIQSAFACNPTAGFTNTNSSAGNNLLQITFTNTSTSGTLTTNQYAQYIVRFGDGTSSYVGYGGNVSHNYSSTGTYIATMVALVIDSPLSTIVCGDSTTTSVTVSYPACGSMITVSLGSGGNATLTATTPGTTGMTYSWDFGDTNTGTGSPVTHTYASNGYYTVTLTATSSAPCTWTSTLVVHILSAFTYSCTSAHAAFTSSTSFNTASFTNTSTAPTSSQSVNPVAVWYYGDGSSGPGTSHTYAGAGTYNVCLAMTWFDSLTSTQLCHDSTCNSVTVAAPPNDITGTLHFDTTSTCNVATPAYQVWLIKYDATSLVLSAVDSVILSYPASSYTFSGEPAGTYRVKAMVINGPTSGTGPLPTYGLDSLYWNNCDSFTYSGTGLSAGHNINLQCGTVTSGPGFISGNVTLGANKGTKTTNGQPGIEILIANASGTTLAYALTDALGDFTFTNLPVASGAGSTYRLYPEVLGYQNTPWYVTLTTANPGNSSSSVHISTNHHTAVPTAISNVSTPANDILVYPNPTTGVVNISCTENAHAFISDVVGHKVYEANINQGNTQLNLSKLSSGMYFLNIKSADINYSNKIILQH